MIDTSTLENIFLMITPSDLLGAQKLTLGAKSSDQQTIVKELLDILYNVNGHGALTAQSLKSKLDEIPTGASADAKKQYKRLLKFYSTSGYCNELSKVQNIALDKDGVTEIKDIVFDQIIGSDVKLNDVNKSMCIVSCNSPFISPANRNAEKTELFLNFLPTIIASRMLPFLELEFQFNRGVPDEQTSIPKHWAPGLTKFLMGGNPSVDPTSPTGKMIAARECLDTKNKQIHTLAGMEMFTSPQTLLNPDPTANAGRYVDILDPFRPLMSIESFSVNVSPTVGLYSYKKATLTLKLHDRSRLNEIADLIRPQLYQDKLSAPTIWITYGWRYPDEPGNPYAEFINGNMLLREAFGIINSSFSLDKVGQVTITLELWTKGVSDLRTIGINVDGSLKVINDLKLLASTINTYLSALGVQPTEGVNKEIRSHIILEAASRGAYPDMTGPEITSAISNLKSALKGPNPKLDKSLVQNVIDELTKLDKSYLQFKQQLDSQSTNVVEKKFRETMTGIDPFLPSSSKDATAQTEMDAETHPYTKAVEVYNSAKGSVDVTKIKGSKPTAFRKKIVSLGKLVSVFFANVFKNLESVDELQLYFYQFNDSAGNAKSTNISEFPIEMPVFLDQYREHVQRKGSEFVTLEEFMQLVIDTQISDPRSIAYGFSRFYAPYDPNSKTEIKLAKGISPEKLELEQGKFQMPAISVHVETTFAAKESNERVNSIDLLSQFESSATMNGAPNGTQSENYVRVMRVHVFDKTANPYKLAAKLLKSDDETTFTLLADEEKKIAEAKAALASDVTTFKKIIKQLTNDAKLDMNLDGALSNDEIKKYISKMVPTITYGTNASSVSDANLSSRQDALLSTTMMQAMASKTGKSSPISTNGSDIGGLPMRIIPASMTLTALGCPLLTYAQIFFVDFNTGTTIDNLYNVTGLQHTISPGKFESQLTLTFADAYGQFFGAPKIIDYFKNLNV